MPPKKNLKLSSVRLRRLSEFSRGGISSPPAAAKTVRTIFEYCTRIETNEELFFRFICFVDCQVTFRHAIIAKNFCFRLIVDKLKFLTLATCSNRINLGNSIFRWLENT